MKNLIYLFVFLSLGTLSAQETFKKLYHVPSKIKMNYGDVVELKKETKVMFDKMTAEEQQKIKDKYPLNSEYEVEREEIIDGNKVIVHDKIKIDDEFYKKQFIKKNIPVEFKGEKKSFVKLVDNKLFVNPYFTVKDDEVTNREIYSYELANRQTIKLRFKEFNVSGLLIPIKYRFKENAKDIPEEFTVSANANLFFGFSMGKTSFHYREKVDNVSNTWKFTFGAFVGATSIKLNSTNTSSSSAPLTSEITKGAASTGVGMCFSFNKINFGGFYGYDYAFGDDTEKWNYNKKPWLGIAVGYSLFNF
jgi:hypothetical protein